MENKVTNINPQTVFLIIGLIYGLGFLLITPPLQIIDEGSHFNKALCLSEGHVLPEILNNRGGYYVPENAYELEWKFDPTINMTLRIKHERIKTDDIFQLLYQPLNDEYEVFTGNICTAAIVTYSPIPYLASAFAIKLGKILNFSIIILMYISRLANLLVWLFFIYMAIKITPVHKWVLLMLSLMPMAIFQGASISVDSFTIALSFLVIAIFLNYSFDNSKKEINRKDISFLFVLMLLLALTKQTYLFLVFLFFLIPINKFGSIKKMFLVFSRLFISTLFISIIWNMIVQRFYTPIYPISIAEQTSFILSNPLNFPNALITTLLTKGFISGIISSFVCNLGWEEFAVHLPGGLIVIYLSMLILTSLFDKKRIKISIKQKIITFITFLVIFVLICLSMYITGTPVGQKTINFIVGRYLIPIAPLLFLLFYNNKIKFDINKGFNLIIISSIIFSLTITIYLLIKKFYFL